MKIGKEYKLKTIYSSQKSFGGKAVTRTDVSEKWNASYHSLFSCETFIIELKEFANGEKVINAITDNDKHFTPATVRHLNEFMKQNNMPSHTKKEWLKIQSETVNYDY